MSVWRTGNKSEKVQAIKLRWRVAYKVASKQTNETGEIPEFTLA